MKVAEVINQIKQTDSTVEKKSKTTALSDEQIIELKWRFMEHANRLVRTTKPNGIFEIDENNKSIIDGLFWWFFNDSRSCYDLRKGILIKGDKGTGKTTIVKAFRNFFADIQKGFVFETALKISQCYARTGDVDIWLQEKLVAIDEIGRENIAKNYGNELNTIGYILHERYSIWQSKGIVTIATTNLDSDEIEDYYGDIIRDRTKEMFNHISMIGDSRRN